VADPEQLQVYLLTMQKQGVILPADSIAEIITYEPLQRIEETPDWFLGLLGWRGVQVPVVSFEILTTERASFSLVSVSSASLVIMRGTSDQNSLRFYALVSQTEPRHYEVTPEMLFETGEGVERTEVSRVRLHNDVLSVPNLDYIEASLLNALIQ
jgi:chemosensory pili system protein ChpC